MSDEAFLEKSVNVGKLDGSPDVASKLSSTVTETKALSSFSSTTQHEPDSSTLLNENNGVFCSRPTSSGTNAAIGISSDVSIPEATLTNTGSVDGSTLAASKPIAQGISLSLVAETQLPASLPQQESAASLMKNTGVSSLPNFSRTTTPLSVKDNTFPEKSNNAGNKNDSSATAASGSSTISLLVTDTQVPSNPLSNEQVSSTLLKYKNTPNTVMSNGIKKKPYRRTKRPAGYNDRSSITTTTNSMLQCPLNAYDAVLQESQDLLLAAQEAQQLGRLKMTSAYLLLLHARLVGLSKRFDRTNQLNMYGSDREKTDESELGSSPCRFDHVDSHNEESEKGQFKPMGETNNNEEFLIFGRENLATSMERQEQTIPNRTTRDENETTTTAVEALAKWLPNNIELDTAMIEHLAKAAAELHSARSGRTNPNHLADGTLPTPDEFLATTANQAKGIANAAALRNLAPSFIGSSSSIVWTPSEISKLNAAVAKGKNDPKLLTKLVPGKSEQQVRAYLRNQVERARIEADLELPETMISGSTVELHPRKKLKTGTDTKFAVVKASARYDTSSNNVKIRAKGSHDPTVPAECEMGYSAQKKKGGGRGRKPQTAAMNTVPNAVCNARALMQGFLLKPGEVP